jgi:glucose/arabinose dehydrogenase
VADGDTDTGRRRPRLLALVVTAIVLGAGAIAVAALSSGDKVHEDLVGTTPSEESTQPAGTTASAKEARRGVRLNRIGTFDDPLYVTAPPGDKRRLFVVEQPGRISVLQDGRRVGHPFLDIRGLVTSGGEQGLLSMAFAPDYARSGRFYVYYTDNDEKEVVAEYRRLSRSPTTADRASRRQVMRMDDPFPNHNGGLLVFGPDRLLYIGTGDGGSGGDPFNNAQNLNSLLGKILRIDPRQSGSRPYTVPRSNPFVGRGGRDEIYSYGLRNPWRYSFDRATGDLYIGDVGQDTREEIDYARRGGAKGRNYGWSCFEGRRHYDDSRNCPGASPPTLDYGRPNGECSVTGGYVVRDSGLPALRGRYVYGDYCRGQVRSLRISGSRATDDGSLGLTVPELSSFGQDARGRIYATSLNGPVYRLTSR